VRALAVRAEISYVMVKPDGVQRGLVGDIISRFERKGFKLVALKLYQTPKEVAEEHYKDLSARPFYNDLVKYIVSGPVVGMVSMWLVQQQPQQRTQCSSHHLLYSHPAAAAALEGSRSCAPDGLLAMMGQAFCTQQPDHTHRVHSKQCSNRTTLRAPCSTLLAASVA
jgi:hypothetical protein